MPIVGDFKLDLKCDERMSWKLLKKLLQLLASMGAVMFDKMLCTYTSTCMFSIQRFKKLNFKNIVFCLLKYYPFQNYNIN